MMIFMDLCLLLMVLLVFIFNPFRVESWNLSEEEDLELEGQLKLLNKPAIKTISTDYGDVYDCVDFYKQPAFDHPLLRNFTFERSTLLRIQKRGRVSSKNAQRRGLHGGGCPLGTVPIKRITKEDLIREKSASKLIQPFKGVEPNIPQRREEPPAEIYKKVAIGRTKAGGDRYKGMSGIMSIYNPQCIEEQYSAARMKMINGPDSVEVGWRVDPTFISGDNLTRFYIRTDVGQTHCFNIRCPGFVVTRTDNPIDIVAERISQIGGPIYGIKFIIERDDANSLILKAGLDNEQIGFWPAAIFSVSGGLGELASSLEWGGEVYSPTGVPKPPMGSGNLPVDDTNFCTFMGSMFLTDDTGTKRDPSELEIFADSENFQIKDEGYLDWPNHVGHLITFGGPGGSTD